MSSCFSSAGYKSPSHRAATGASGGFRAREAEVCAQLRCYAAPAPHGVLFECLCLTVAVTLGTLGPRMMGKRKRARSLIAKAKLQRNARICAGYRTCMASALPLKEDCMGISRDLSYGKKTVVHRCVARASGGSARTSTWTSSQLEVLRPNVCRFRLPYRQPSAALFGVSCMYIEGPASLQRTKPAVRIP